MTTLQKGPPLPGIDKDIKNVKKYHQSNVIVLKSSKHENCLLSMT
jgi:hypothetical protein